MADLWIHFAVKVRHSVEIVDMRELPSEFVLTKIEYQPRKTQIKDALKGGQAVPGVHIVERQSLVIN